MSDAARNTINTWVEKTTNGKIKDLIPQGALTSLTRLVLTNAVYFKGTWEEVFRKDATRPDAVSFNGRQFDRRADDVSESTSRIWSGEIRRR